MTTFAWDSPARVNWSHRVTTDQVSATGDEAQTRSFPTLVEALRFVMEDLQATERMMVGVYPERGTALINLGEIERAYRTRPDPLGDRGGEA